MAPERKLCLGLADVKRYGVPYIYIIILIATTTIAVDVSLPVIQQSVSLLWRPAMTRVTSLVLVAFVASAAGALPLQDVVLANYRLVSLVSHIDRTHLGTKMMVIVCSLVYGLVSLMNKLKL